MNVNLPQILNISSLNSYALSFMLVYVGFLVIFLCCTSILLFKLITVIFRALCNRGSSTVASMSNEETLREALGIIEQARLESLKIIKEAQLEHTKLISDAVELSDESKDLLAKNLASLYDRQQKHLEDLEKTLVQRFESVLDEARAVNLTTVRDITDSLKTELKTSVAEIHESIEKKALASEEQFDNELHEHIKQFDADIQKYKEKKLKDFRDNFEDLAAEVLTVVAGKKLEVGDIEDILIKQLDIELKKKGL